MIGTSARAEASRRATSKSSMSGSITSSTSSCGGRAATAAIASLPVAADSTEALEAQCHRDHVDDVGLVVDDEDAHLLVLSGVNGGIVAPAPVSLLRALGGLQAAGRSAIRSICAGGRTRSTSRTGARSDTVGLA